MSRVVVTGAGGFLGRLLSAQLTARGDEVVGVDVVPGPGVVAGDVTDPAFLASVIAPGVDAVVHLASMVSAECELRYEDAFRVNVGGLRAVLAAAGAVPGPVRPRLLFTSSVAVFSAPEVDDHTRPVPLSTYGATKAIGELLVNDATRKGFVDGRVARLPTVIVRPGLPNAAASGFASGMFREPLRGVDAVVPVDPATPIVLIGAGVAVAGMVGLLDADADALGLDRVVNLPALEVTVAAMIDALAHTGRATGRLTVAPDPVVTAVVGTWAGRWRADRAAALGLPADASLDAVVAEHLAST